MQIVRDSSVPTKQDSAGCHTGVGSRCWAERCGSVSCRGGVGWRRTRRSWRRCAACRALSDETKRLGHGRSEEHTSELQSLMRISYAVFCLKQNQLLKNTVPTYSQQSLMHRSYLDSLSS